MFYNNNNNNNNITTVLNQHLHLMASYCILYMIIQVQKEVGGCRPLYNIWSSILEGAICVHFILPYVSNTRRQSTRNVNRFISQCRYCQLIDYL